jgi:hypothetical protein
MLTIARCGGGLGLARAARRPLPPASETLAASLRDGFRVCRQAGTAGGYDEEQRDEPAERHGHLERRRSLGFRRRKARDIRRNVSEPGTG